MDFNNTAFANTLSTYNSTDLILNGSWVQWNGITGNNNAVLEYSYFGQNFRTWNQESSQTNVPLTSLNLGLMVSCKIDYLRSDQDNHIIILVGFMLYNNAPKICFAQALVEFAGNSAANFNTGPVTSGDISQGIYDSLNTGSGSCFSYVAKANIDCIAASIS